MQVICLRPASSLSFNDFQFAASGRVNHAAKIGKRLRDFRILTMKFTRIVSVVASRMSPTARTKIYHRKDIFAILLVSTTQFHYNEI